MQVAIIEFARHVCGFHDAHSVELDPNTTHPVIALMPDQNGVEDIGGTLRLGSYPCVLDPTSKAHMSFTVLKRSMRHRHRYEVNNDFRAALTEGGMKLCGTSPDGRIVEMIEIPDHRGSLQHRLIRNSNPDRTVHIRYSKVLWKLL